ncbi:hypothetical protein AB6A40_010028 [Gnathostoma spinigerum]|uniref:NADH dehydrogenase [ubiquinone] 1 alpha subcomplex subunit 7 n=1 Tax=Gnathostoma spinigerum TaxID=75299 RepID=A0ABD6EYU8_9BILA
MASGRKIASALVENRSQTPFWTWIRNKLLAVNRQPITPPPGLPGPDGKVVYHNNLRFPNSQSARDQPPPNVPGGVHHKLAENYYLDRDARRSVIPPNPLYASDGRTTRFGNAAGDEIKVEDAVKVNKGPHENFGLEAPTPGFGIEWKRNSSEELTTQKFDKNLRLLEKYDSYTSSN